MMAVEFTNIFPINWRQKNQGKIKQVMEEVHKLHIGKKFPIDEALLKLKFQSQLLLNHESQVILYYSVKAKEDYVSSLWTDLSTQFLEKRFYPVRLFLTPEL